MREETSRLRETQLTAAGASRINRRRALVRGLAICLLFGIFLTFAGVRTAYNGGFLARVVYMTAISLVAYLTAMTMTLLLFRIAFLARRRWIGAIIVGLTQAPLMGLFVWAGDNLMTVGSRPASLIGGYILVSLAISLFMNLLVQLMTTDRLVVVERTLAAPTVRFMDRLPPKLRGARVFAVEAEDHYLRLHTSKGQDLILMRLADAVAELEGIEGMQVHRSWWVARDAVAGIARGDGRATLTLSDGAEVPVSRTYAKALRERGWL